MHFWDCIAPRKITYPENEPESPRTVVYVQHGELKIPIKIYKDLRVRFQFAGSIIPGKYCIVGTGLSSATRILFAQYISWDYLLKIEISAFCAGAGSVKN